MACPPGTFRSEGAALASHSCLTCPADFFNPLPGQKACLPCGSEAAQPAEGQETCICLGKGQVFQVQGQPHESCSGLAPISIPSHFTLLTSPALPRSVSPQHRPPSILYLIPNYADLQGGGRGHQIYMFWVSSGLHQSVPFVGK